MRPSNASNRARCSSTAASVSDIVVRRTRARPVSISKSTHPNAQMSARLSTGLPARLLGAHVRRRAENHAAPASSPATVMRRRLRDASADAAAPAPIGFRQPEVEHLHRAVRRAP